VDALVERQIELVARFPVGCDLGLLGPGAIYIGKKAPGFTELSIAEAS
jgi:hypothetical protein